MDIRRASPADAGDVFALVEQLADHYDVDRDEFESAYRDALGSPDRSILFVAEVDGVIAGYVLVTVARLLYTRTDSALIQELIVDGEHRGRGIGTALVATVEEYCKHRGIDRLTVSSSRAPAFYDSLDYRSTADYLKKDFSEPD